MTVATVATSADPLAPVREALLGRARAEAATQRAAADADAAAALAEARHQVDELRAQARAQGTADGAAVVAGERSLARRHAREVVLAARRDAYKELRLQARAAVEALRADPSYAAWLTALRARARAELGAEASISEHPDGGVVAIAEHRRMEYGLAALADAAVERLGPDVEALWQP